MSQVSSILDLVKCVTRVKCVNIKRKSITLKTCVNVNAIIQTLIVLMCYNTLTRLTCYPLTFHSSNSYANVPCVARTVLIDIPRTVTIGGPRVIFYL